MQESLESLLLMEFPLPKPNVVSRLEPEEELGVPDPNDSKEWEILRVAPPDDGTGSEEEGEEESPEPFLSEPAELAVTPCRGAEGMVSHFPVSGDACRSSPPRPASPPRPWDPLRFVQEHPARRRRWRRRRRQQDGGGDDDGEDAANACGRCRESYSRRSEQAGGEKPYKCLDCGKGFTRSSNRNAHQRLHAGPRPFPSLAGGGGNHHRSSEATEIRSPRADRPPYPRSESGTSFGRSSEAACRCRCRCPCGCRRQQRGGRGGERPCRCSRCGKGLERDSHLDGRRRIRPGRRPYACGDCGKSFSYSSAFLKHRRSHGDGDGGDGDGGESPHRCPQCGKGFKQSSGLLRHQRVHLG
ncbi:uncharacterized protein LOC141735149 [Larus michahellis]|uniref:uncharacterized protein LOC141735149 n=1 Tax=Larus michahellis TaxID=119627 RepID=UPI003D9BC327